MKNLREKIIFFDEIILILVGVCILISVHFVWNDGHFMFWWIAKGLYIVGVIIHLFVHKLDLGNK
ncbi:MAG: hypothetical protein ACI9AR_000564 [Flavobacteriaceae bacterium]|jgi:hypothetical protein